tara:strand:- start:201 stop:836 length:636 start_codon:yes stop_codon:yes gene_type:complete
MPIAINGDGTITGVTVGGLPDGIVDADMLASNAVTSGKLASGVGGKILQVKSATKTDYQSSQSGSFVDITGLSVTLTPSSSSSKILVQYSLQYSGSNNGYNSARCVFNDNGGSFAVAGPVSDALSATNGDALGGKQLALDTDDAYGVYKLPENSMQFFHEPSSINALIYKIQFRVGYTYNNKSLWINRTANIGNDPRTTGISNITVMEVAA